MEWKPRRSVGGVVGLVAIAFLLIAAMWFTLTALRNPVSLSSFVVVVLTILSLSLAAWIGYLVFGYFTLRYSLDRNALIINWASSKQVIPLDRIIDARKGAELTNRISKSPRFRWWGYMVGLGRIAGIGSTLFYATSPLKSQVIVSTSSLNYAISPPDIEAFLSDLESYRRVGTLRPLDEKSERSAFADHPFWRDRSVHFLIGLGVLINALLFAYISWRYRGLPDLLPLHFDSQGIADIISPRDEIFRIPTAGLLILCVNLAIGVLVHRHERLASYVLFGSIVATQLLLLIPILHTVH
jgi:hypothetical protein